MRLIDADKLIKTLGQSIGNNGNVIKINVIDVKYLISEQLTAYDADKVVEQLEELKHPYTSFDDGRGALKEYDYYIDKAKSIVKGGIL